MNELKFIDFIKVFLQKPNYAFNTLLNQTKYKYIYIMPLILGCLMGINDIMNKAFLSNIDLNASIVFISFSKEIILTIFLCFFYSLIIQFLNSLFQGLSNQRMVFAVIAYSLFPLIVGALLISILKIIFYALLGFSNYSQYLFQFLYLIYLGFYILTIILLIIGNSVANKFSIMKSFLASSILPIVFTIYEIVSYIK